jgi:hypothetical protein
MHYLRLKKARQIGRKLFRTYHGVWPDQVPMERRKYYRPSVAALAGIYRKVRKPCSRACCGNPRKWYGEKTRQEKIADIDAAEQIDTP